jgi:hypothetical protein
MGNACGCSTDKYKLEMKNQFKESELKKEEVNEESIKEIINWATTNCKKIIEQIQLNSSKLMETIDYFKSIIEKEINNESKIVTTFTIIDEISNILPLLQT